MTTQENRYQLQPLGIGAIYRLSFGIVLGNLGKLIGLMLLIYIPFNLVEFLAYQALIPAAPEISGMEELLAFAAEREAAETTVSFILMLIHCFLVVPITTAGVMFIVGGLYAGEQIGIGGSLSRAKGRIVPMVVTYILCVLAIFGGLILLIIPGIVFAIWLLVATEVAVFEGIAGPNAMKRSRQLMRGASASLILLCIAFALTFLVIQIVTITALAGLSASPILVLLGWKLANTACLLVTEVSWVLYYFSARCRHETFTPEMLRLSLAGEQQSVISEGASAS